MLFISDSSIHGMSNPTNITGGIGSQRWCSCSVSSTCTLAAMKTRGLQFIWVDSRVTEIVQ